MFMTNHPAAVTTTTTSTAAQMLKSHDSRGRDIKRRLDVIQKKMADLQELGVPCAFCYISTRNTGSLFTMGNKAMTKIIEDSRDIILDNLSEVHTPTPDNTRHLAATNNTQHEVRMVLPPLPQPLEELNLHDLRALVVGIVKDLGLKWSDQRPPFWPETVPFQYPRTAPEGFQGSWTKTLREITRSLYTYYGHNPDTYYKCPTPAANTDTNSGKTNHYFFPNSNTSINQTIVTIETEVSDEECEEIDVGMSYHAPEQLPIIAYPNRPLTNVTTTMKQADDDSPDEDVISVCSDEQPTVNYFGYEMAPSESHSSSIGSTHSSPSSGATTPSPGSKPALVTQPQLLYCSPQLCYQTPFLLPPNLLMKHPLLYTNAITTNNPVEGKEADKNGLSLSPKFTLQNQQHFTSLNLHKSPTHSFMSRHSINTSSDNNSAKQLPTVTQPSPEAAKNKKNRNNGMYIYTTPTEPLKFMSLNNKTNSTSPKVSNKKMVTMAPVVPEKVIMNKMDFKRMSTINRKMANSRNAGLHIPGSHSTQQNRIQSVPNRTTNALHTETTSTSMKRKRELIFHWYHTPGNAPNSSTSPPNTKRMHTEAAGTM